MAIISLPFHHHNASGVGGTWNLHLPSCTCRWIPFEWCVRRGLMLGPKIERIKCVSVSGTGALFVDAVYVN